MGDDIVELGGREALHEFDRARKAW